MKCQLSYIARLHALCFSNSRLRGRDLDSAALSHSVAKAARAALQQLHQRGIAHGDVRLPNFMLLDAPTEAAPQARNHMPSSCSLVFFPLASWPVQIAICPQEHVVVTVANTEQHRPSTDDQRLQILCCHPGVDCGLWAQLRKRRSGGAGARGGGARGAVCGEGAAFVAFGLL